MNKEPYKRKAGDFEIRVLPDGRLVMIAPDETLVEVAESLECEDKPENEQDGEKQNAGIEPDTTGQKKTKRT